MHKFKGNPHVVNIIEDPPLLEDDEELLIPKSIVDHDLTTTHSSIEYHRYLVKYKNQSLEECQWLPASSLSPTYQHYIPHTYEFTLKHGNHLMKYDGLC